MYIEACWRGQKLFQHLTPSTYLNIYNMVWFQNFLQIENQLNIKKVK